MKTDMRHVWRVQPDERGEDHKKPGKAVGDPIGDGVGPHVADSTINDSKAEQEKSGS